MPKLSVVIITYNEERNIARCINSVKEVADDILVVDSFSRDKTEKIVKDLGARFIQHHFEGHIEQKNWAIKQAMYPHILSLDADEFLSNELKASINAIKDNWEFDGYYFSRLTSYCGKWIRHGSWYPSKKLRLWDSRKGRWSGTNPHDIFEMKAGSKTRFLKGNLLHHSYLSIEEHVNQTNGFSEIIARSYFRKGRRASFSRILLHPVWRFVRDYFIKVGILDGFYGFTIAIVSAHETFLKYVKLKELYNRRDDSHPYRICFFNSTISWGGGERWHYDVSTRISEAGRETLIISGVRSELDRRIGYTHQPQVNMKITNLSFLNPAKVLRLARILRNEKVHTIIINLSSDLKIAGIAARMAGVPRIIYRRGSAIPVRNSFFNRFLYRKIVTEVIANSEETKKTILQNNATLIGNEKIHVIYNGIDLDEHDSRSFAPIYTKQDGEIVIGNAGRLTEEKGQAFLIELASELKNRKVNFRILIAGKGQLETRLKRLAQKSEVHDKIEFLGFIQNIRDFYSSLDVYALTSIWEGFGYVLIEAMADMIPVIAFDIGSSREIVKEGETGYIVGFKDVKGLADRIEQFYLDRKLMKSMGSKGRKRVEHVFAMDHSMKQINDLLKPDLPE